MKYGITFLCLLYSLFVSAQNGIEIFSQGRYIHDFFISGNKAYLTTAGTGLVIFNLDSGTYQKLNLSNTPVYGGGGNSLQVLNDDTMLVVGMDNSWLVANGYWQKLYAEDFSNITSIIAADGTLFNSRYNNGQITCQRLVNGVWQDQNNTDIFTPSGIYANDFNELYSENYRYVNGDWEYFPEPTAPVGTYNVDYRTYLFDSQKNPWIVLENEDSTQNTLLGYNGQSWINYTIPFHSSYIKATGIVNDSLGNTILYIIASGNGMYENNMYRWNVNTGVVDFIPDLYFITAQNYGSNGNVFTYNGVVYAASLNSFMKSYDGINFVDIPYGNTCVRDFLIAQTVDRKDSFYIVGGDNNIYVTDTTFSYCQLLDTSSVFFDYMTRVLFKDKNDDVWLMRSNGTYIQGLTRDTIINIPQSISNMVNQDNRVVDFQIFGDTVYLCIGSSPTVLAYKLLPDGSILQGVGAFYKEMDNYGYLWADYHDLDNINTHVLIRSKGENQTDVVRTWNCDPYYCQGSHHMAKDKQGNIWGQIPDSLILFQGNEQLTETAWPLPHNVSNENHLFMVVDSNEILLNSFESMQYYKNGIWNIYDARFSSYNGFAYSFHDGRFLFITETAGLLKYNLNGSFFTNGNKLSGTLYGDINASGSLDNNDAYFDNTLVTVNNEQIQTNSIGRYLADVPNGTYVIKPPFIQYYTAAPDSYTVAANGSNFDTLHFAYSAPTPVNDLEVHITPMPFPLGYTGNIYTSVKNNGTAPVNATLTIEYDTALGITYATPQTNSQQPGVAIVQYNNLYPNEIVNGEIHFQMPILFPDGDSSLRFVATIAPLAGDTTPANNVDSITEYPVSSYDPNDKLVSPAGLGIYNTIDTNQELTYTIRFQNTGTYKAINIMLADTLSSKLDVSTFHYIGSSATCTYAIKNHVLTVNFKNINLPHAEENEPGSHGYFKFKIKPVDAIAYGDSITNKAYIYFDFNEAIITNETEVTFGPVVYANNPNFNPSETITVFPQPFTNTLNFHVNNAVSLPATAQLYDINGKVVAEKAIATATESLQTGNLAVGTYTLRIVDSQKQRFSTNCIKVK